MNLKPIFTTEIEKISRVCDCTFGIPKSKTRIRLEWSSEGIYISCEGGATACLCEGELSQMIDNRKYLHKWHADKQNYELYLSRVSGESKFATIHVAFISDENEWNSAKRNIDNNNKAAIFQIEINDIDEHIVGLITGSADKAAILDYVYDRIADFKSLEGKISNSYDCVLKRWQKIAYMLNLDLIASGGNCNHDKNLSEIKRYLSNKG